MNSLHLIYFLVLLGVCPVTTGYVHKDTVSTAYRNPVFEPVLADPSVFRDPKSNMFYAYGTEDDWADQNGWRWVPILESANLVDWKYVGQAFCDKPSWKGEGRIWAPDINYVDGQYFLYYSYSTWGDKNPGVGLAIADSPKGPFIDQGRLFDSKQIDVPNSIDPFFYEENGKRYLFWGSFSQLPGQGTYAVELTDDGKQVKNMDRKIKIAAGDFEAVMIYRHKDYFYFLGSKGSCCEGKNSTYRVMAARSKNLLGPYLDKEGNDITARGNGTLILEGNGRYAGPGHNSGIITDANGKDWILYHAIDKKQGKLENGISRRVLMLDQLKWKNGWPYIEGSVPSLNTKNKPVF